MSNEPKQQLLKAGSSTDAQKLSGSIVAQYQKEPDTAITIRVIGPSAVNQAIKAVIIANRFFIKKGLIILLLPAFEDLVGTDSTMTAIEFRLKITRL